MNELLSIEVNRLFVYRNFHRFFSAFSAFGKLEAVLLGTCILIPSPLKSSISDLNQEKRH